MPDPADRRATVLGRGVAALTCARALRRSGWNVTLDGPRARPVPVLLLGTPTVQLLESLWGRLDVGQHVLRGRLVRWGARPAAESPDGGLLVDGAALLEELERRDARARVARDATGSGDGWVVQAAGRGSLSGTRRLGCRVLLHARVELRPGTDEGLSCMETVGEGWLFLIPTGAGAAVLQAMVPVPPADPAVLLQRMLGAACEVAARVSDLTDDEVTVIGAATQARDPVAASGCLAVGDAARAFDPLAGDGTGQAVRGALLAAAVLESRARGLAEQTVLDHYDHRVRLGFLRHLVHLVRFYGEAFPGSVAWQAELGALCMELDDPENRALAVRPFSHRLVGDRLEAR